MEIEIGSQFVFSDIQLKVVEVNTYKCDGCFFKDNILICRKPKHITCYKTERQDGKSVIFKEIIAPCLFVYNSE